MEVVASLSQGRTAAAQCGLFTYKSVPVIFEPPCTFCPQCAMLCCVQNLEKRATVWVSSIDLLGLQPRRGVITARYEVIM